MEPQQEDQDVVDAAEAVAGLTATLEQWTSPKLGTVTMHSYTYDRDPEAWLQRDEEEEDAMMIVEDNDDLTTPKQPNKRTLERANTPIMSNSSSKKKNKKQTITTPQDDDEDSEVPFNVQSPWVGATSPAFSTVVERTKTPAIIRRSKPSSQGTTHVEYRRYHDALKAYFRNKRAVMQQIGILQQEQQDAMLLHDDDLQTTNQRLASNEQKIELEFLRNLNVLCYDRNHSIKEGNFWWLLHTLRKLGLAALIWNDDAASIRQHQSSIASFLDTLALQTTTTPAHLIAEFRKNTAPLALQRRRHILIWLEQCFQNVLPARSTRALKTTAVLNSSLSAQGLYETDKDDELFRACLALVLAGRLDDAKKLARDCHISWRAALWGGGAPHGFHNGGASTGNPRRALWRRMIWRHASTLNADPVASSDEAAIAAILSSNLKVSLDNSSMRTWEKGLYATVRAGIDRMEDQLLHLHNNHRRTMRPPFPGTEHESKEIEHLQATADIGLMMDDEASIVKMLDSSPFEEMQCRDPITLATACFLAGKRAIVDFMDNSRMELANRRNIKADDDGVLRFTTHLALYLDSLSVCTTPIVLDGVSDWKNELVLDYVRHLASREDLWYMLVLYASLLPQETILDELPVLLSYMESQEERKVLVEQLDEFLPCSGLALQVLRRVVNLVFAEEDPNPMLERAATSPTSLDISKMKAVLWLCFRKEHAGDALIAANSLLRQFLFAYKKVHSAVAFVDDILPDQILVDVSSQADVDQRMEAADHDYDAQVEHARSEHVAYLSYIEAAKAVDDWKTAIAETDAIAIVSSDDTVDKTLLNATEVSIAMSVERRKLIEEKRKTTQVVVVAADKTRKALGKILEHPGGWLLTEDEDITDGSEDELLRRAELDKLRKKLLPDTVLLYHGVCVETAAWLSKSLDDAIDKVGGSMKGKDMVKQISESSSAMDNSSESPISPRYWTQKALALAQNIESETYCIKSSFSTADFKELMSRLAETAVLDQLYLSYGFE